MEFRWIPRKTMEVEGPSTLDSLIGAIFSHNDNIECKFCAQTCEAAGPAVKKIVKIVEQMLHPIGMQQDPMNSCRKLVE